MRGRIEIALNIIGEGGNGRKITLFQRARKERQEEKGRREREPLEKRRKYEKLIKGENGENM